jgi:hypothetical protein
LPLATPKILKSGVMVVNLDDFIAWDLLRNRTGGAGVNDNKLLRIGRKVNSIFKFPFADAVWNAGVENARQERVQSFNSANATVHARESMSVYCQPEDTQSLVFMLGIINLFYQNKNK